AGAAGGEKTPATKPAPPFPHRARGRFPPEPCHSRKIRSSPADAKVVPSGENATLHTVSAWPPRFRKSFPSDTRQIRNSGSEMITWAPEASRSPSGENATHLTHCVSPRNVIRSLPSRTFQSSTVLSSDAEASTVPLGEKATALMTSVCPLNVRRSFPSEIRHSNTVEVSGVVANSVPSGEKAAAPVVTQALCPSPCRVARRFPSATRQISADLSSSNAVSVVPSGENMTPSTAPAHPSVCIRLTFASAEEAAATVAEGFRSRAGGVAADFRWLALRG